MGFLPEFLQKKSIVPVQNLDDFKFLDRDQFLVDMDVEGLAKKAGKTDLPTSQSTEQDANEKTFIQELKQHASSARMTLNKTLSQISNEISKIDLETEKAQIDSAVDELRADLTSNQEETIQDLKKFKEIAQNRESDLERFKKDNGLSREARYKTSYLATVAIILAFLVVETSLNSTLLAKASDLGLVGGMAQAVIISLINIVIGFGLGFLIYPRTNQKSKRLSMSWRAVLIFGFAAVLIFNLLIGHYRESLVFDPDSSTLQAIANFTSGMFDLSDIESIFLVAIGIIVAGVSYWKGSTQNDPYFEYTTYAKALEKAVDDLADEKEISLEELDEKGEDFSIALDKIHKKAKFDLKNYNSLKSAFSQQQELYSAYIDDLEETAKIASTLYRQTNEVARTSDTPSYFKDSLKIDFYQKPSIPKIDDIGDSLNEAVDRFGKRIPGLKIELKNVLEGYRNIIVAIDI